MRHCPITYAEITNQEYYSQQGLRLLSPQLAKLDTLNLSADEQRSEAINLVGKMSIQGVQKKLSSQLKIKEGRFDIVDQHGQYILKPQSDLYPELPENEAITMTLAKMVGLDVPVHGLVYSKDKSMTYFIKRFDRGGHHKKFSLEDFAQLSGGDRHTKYNSSMERIITIVSEFCTFPKIEFVKLFKLTLFNFLVGNEDMHLKNFSLLSRDNKVRLSPAYDLLNSTIAMQNVKEELALPLNGKKSQLTKKDFLEYFAIDRLQLNQTIITQVVHDIQAALPVWRELIRNSFLSLEMQEKYLNLLRERQKRLGI
jgi:serine/threonine-protein kinase HipA